MRGRRGQEREVVTATPGRFEDFVGHDDPSAHGIQQACVALDFVVTDEKYVVMFRRLGRDHHQYGALGVDVRHQSCSLMVERAAKQIGLEPQALQRAFHLVAGQTFFGGCQLLESRALGCGKFDVPVRAECGDGDQAALELVLLSRDRQVQYTRVFGEGSSRRDRLTCGENRKRQREDRDEAFHGNCLLTARTVPAQVRADGPGLRRDCPICNQGLAVVAISVGPFLFVFRRPFGSQRLAFARQPSSESHMNSTRRKPLTLKSARTRQKSAAIGSARLPQERVTRRCGEGECLLRRVRVGGHHGLRAVALLGNLGVSF